MAPKKKEQQKMSLGTFLQDEKLGSWADEMEDMPLYSRANYAERRAYTSSYGPGTTSGGYSIREELPLPDKPPYTVHLGNLSFDATTEDVKDFFAECECINVRIIEDRIENKPKGFGYAEFQTLEGLKTALTLNSSQFQGRNIRISVADPPKDRERDRPDVRELGEWSRKGPLPDLPGQRTERRGFGSGRPFGEPSEGGERRERQFNDDGKVRDFGNWERKGPLSPLPQAERPTSSRDGRPRTNDGPKAEGFRDRRSSPAAWGEGRGQGSQDGSRPPRREFYERPERPERTPTAAEQDNQWRARMKPDAPADSKSPVQEAETPSPPQPAIATRPKLNLAKRTVSDVHNLPSPSLSDSKPNPFGGARPIDTATKEKEIEEKKLKERKDAEEKAREEKRLAKEAAAAKAAQAASEAAEGAETPETEKTEGVEKTEETPEKDVNGKAAEEKPSRPRDAPRDARPKPSATESSWRRPSGGPKAPRGDYRGARGDGPPRGPRGDGARGPRTNGGPSAASSPPPAASSPSPADPETAALEAEGWSTVSNAKQRKNQRGNPGARAIAS